MMRASRGIWNRIWSGGDNNAYTRSYSGVVQPGQNSIDGFGNGERRGIQPQTQARRILAQGVIQGDWRPRAVTDFAPSGFAFGDHIGGWTQDNHAQIVVGFEAVGDRFQISTEDNILVHDREAPLRPAQPVHSAGAVGRNRRR